MIDKFNTLAFSLIVLLISACSSMNIMNSPYQQSSDSVTETAFIVSNPDGALDQAYQLCVNQIEANTAPGDVATKGVDGTLLLSGAAAVATGMAGAVSAVPVAVGLVVAGAATIDDGEKYKEYKGEQEIQECLSDSGYKIVIIETNEE